MFGLIFNKWWREIKKPEIFQSEWEEIEHGTNCNKRTNKTMNTQKKHTLPSLFTCSRTTCITTRKQWLNQTCARTHTHKLNIHNGACAHTHTRLLFSPPLGRCRSFHENMLLMNFPVGSSCSFTTLESSLLPIVYLELVCCFHSKQA